MTRKKLNYSALYILAFINLISSISIADGEVSKNSNNHTLTLQWCSEEGVAFKALKLPPPELGIFEIPQYLFEDQVKFKIRIKASNFSCPSETHAKILTLSVNKPRFDLHTKTWGFLSTGYFRFDNYFYPPDLFCIAKWTKKTVSVRVCREFDEINSSEHSQCGAGVTCIPKCCPEGMLLTRRAGKYPQCHRKLKGSARVNPIMYTKQLNVSSSKIPMYLYLQTFFDKVVHNDAKTEKSIELESFYYFNDKCFKIFENGSLFYLDDWLISWVRIPPTNYCIDGTQLLGNAKTRTEVFNGKEGQYGIIVLEPPDIYGDDFPHFESANLLISSVFFLLTFVVYLLLWKEQKIQGWVTMSHSGTLFLCYALSAAIYLTPEGRSGDMASLCLVLAVSTHFLYLSNFCWLTVTSFSIFRTFSKITTVNRNTKKIFLYMGFAGFAWGVPFIFVTISLILDQKYGYEPCNQVPVPNYGTQECFLSRAAYRIYLVFPVAGLLIINTILFSATAFNLYKYQKSTKFAKENLKDEKDSLKTIAKLFFVMGIVWLIDFLFNIWWAYHHTYIAWIWIIPHIVLFLQALSIFVIYVCKSSIASSLKKLYPILTPLLSFLDKNKSPSRQDTGITRGSGSK